jgi:hypothetical protein
VDPKRGGSSRKGELPSNGKWMKKIQTANNLLLTVTLIISKASFSPQNSSSGNRKTKTKDERVCHYYRKTYRKEEEENIDTVREASH